MQAAKKKTGIKADLMEYCQLIKGYNYQYKGSILKRVLIGYARLSEYCTIEEQVKLLEGERNHL